MHKANHLQLSGDIAATLASLITGFALRFSSPSEWPALTGQAGEKIFAYSLVILFSCYFCGLYDRNLKLDSLGRFCRLAVAVMLAFFLLSSLYYALPVLFIGRGFLSFSLVFFGIFHILIHLSLRTFGTTPIINQRVLIYGAGPLAESMESLMTSSTRGYYSFLGFVLPKGDEVTVAVDKIVGKAEHIEEVVQDQRPHTLVISIPDRHSELPVRKLLRCKVRGLGILDAPSFFESVTGKLLLENIQPNTFVFSEGFQLSWVMRRLKRLMDICLACLGLCLSVPLLPFLSLVIKLDSPGPVIFKQTRVGEDDKLFTIYKLRTMRQDAEQENGATWACENDPRTTRIGHFLRKTRIDEFPQFYNILKGDMSFIGPRPERPEFISHLTDKVPFYSKRHIVKPGLTGWAQVSYPYGASDEDALEKLRYDLYYIKNYSLLFDLLILLETTKVVCFGRGGR